MPSITWCLTYDSSQPQLIAFIDDVGRAYQPACTGNVALPASAFVIGRFTNGYLVQATFDELRVSVGSPRSQAWILTGFNNQKSPATFDSVGSSETQ